MTKVVKIIWFIFLIINSILGFLAGIGKIDIYLFINVLIGTNILCIALWLLGKALQNK